MGSYGGDAVPWEDIGDLSAPNRLSCEREWALLLAEESALLALLKLEEPCLSDDRLREPLHCAVASVGAEETRWRDGSSVLEQRWHKEANLLATKWREEDARLLQSRLAQAGTEAQHHEALLSRLAPPPRVGWAELLRVTQLHHLGATRVAQAWQGEWDKLGCAARELVLQPTGQARADPSGTETAAMMSRRQCRCMLEVLRNAMAPADLALSDEFCDAVCHVMPRAAVSVMGDLFGDFGDLDADSGTAAELLIIPWAAVLCFLLLLVEGATARQRLDLFIERWLIGCRLPHRAAARAAAMPLTLAEQRVVYTDLVRSAAVADVAATMLAASLAGLDSTAVDAIVIESRLSVADNQSCVEGALSQRPHTWQVCPPALHEFAVWCAATEAEVGAAITGGTESADVDEDSVGPSKLEAASDADSGGVRGAPVSATVADALASALSSAAPLASGAAAWLKQQGFLGE